MSEVAEARGGCDVFKWTHPDALKLPHLESDTSDVGLKWPHPETRSSAVLECALPCLGCA